MSCWSGQPRVSLMRMAKVRRASSLGSASSEPLRSASMTSSDTPWELAIAVCAAISRASGRESGSALARGIVARAADKNNATYQKVVKLWHSPEVVAAEQKETKNTAVIVDRPAAQLEQILARLQKDIAAK